MSSYSIAKQASAEKAVREIRRKTRRRFSAEEKIRIAIEGLRGKESIASLCRREGIAANLYYRWSKEFLEAGKKRLLGDTRREANSSEVTDLRQENARLKELVAETVLENRPLFIHPGTGKRWAPTAMRREWHDACERAGVPHVELYEGARHPAATEWKRQGADDRTIQAILGHTDGRSVERSARMANQAVVEVLRPKRGAE